MPNSQTLKSRWFALNWNDVVLMRQRVTKAFRQNDKFEKCKTVESGNDRVGGTIGTATTWDVIYKLSADRPTKLKVTMLYPLHYDEQPRERYFIDFILCFDGKISVDELKEFVVRFHDFVVMNEGKEPPTLLCANSKPARLCGSVEKFDRQNPSFAMRMLRSLSMTSIRGMRDQVLVPEAPVVPQAVDDEEEYEDAFFSTSADLADLDME